MKYFCAQCQARHPVTDIAADLRVISQQEITSAIDSLLEQDTEAGNHMERFALYNDLTRFINTNAQGGRALVFKSTEIPKYLENQHRQGKVLSGTFRLTISWLLSEYRKSETVQANQSAGVTEYIDSVDEELGDRPVYEKGIRFFFDTIDGEDVLNYMTDTSNDPFTDDDRIMRGYLRACPHCGYHISRAVGKAEEIVVALAGSPRAGKTSCLTAIASALVSNRYRDYGFTMEPFQFDQSWEDIKKEIEWYDRGYAVTKTPLDLQAVPSYSFLVRFFNQKRVLTFVDMPGEFWQSGSGLTREFFIHYVELYRNIDCVWFFISKLMAYDVDLGDGEQDWQREMMSNSAEDGSLIRQGSAANLNANFAALKDFFDSYGVRMPPIAVILSKMELDLGQNDRELTRNFGVFPVSDGAPLSNSLGSENLADIEKVMRETGQKVRALNENTFFIFANQVRNFLREVNLGVCYAVEQNCPRRSYIAMAAYGHPAAKRNNASGSERVQTATKATPYHEMFPLIWTLAIMGVIDVVHPCIYSWRAGLFGHMETQNCDEIVNGFRCRTSNGEGKEGKQSVAQEDRAMKLRDIGRNLLMTREKGNGEIKFSVTRIEHKKG